MTHLTGYAGIIQDAEHLSVAGALYDAGVHCLEVCDGDDFGNLSLERLDGQDRRKECLRDADFGSIVLETDCADLADLLLRRNGALGDPVEISLQLADGEIYSARNCKLCYLAVQIAVSLAHSVDDLTHYGYRYNCAGVAGVDRIACANLSRQRSTIVCNSLHQLCRDSCTALEIMHKCFAVFHACGRVVVRALLRRLYAVLCIACYNTTIVTLSAYRCVLCALRGIVTLFCFKHCDLGAGFLNFGVDLLQLFGQAANLRNVCGCLASFVQLCALAFKARKLLLQKFKSHLLFLLV